MSHLLRTPLTHGPANPHLAHLHALRLLLGRAARPPARRGCIHARARHRVPVEHGAEEVGGVVHAGAQQGGCYGGGGLRSRKGEAGQDRDVGVGWSGRVVATGPGEEGQGLRGSGQESEGKSAAGWWAGS